MMSAGGWDIAGWATATAAFLTAVGVVWRTAIRPAVRWARRIETALGFVEHEMRENSGKSLKDAVNRIDARGDVVDKRLESLEGAVAELGPQQITVINRGAPSS